MEAIPTTPEPKGPVLDGGTVGGGGDGAADIVIEKLALATTEAESVACIVTE
jgi:hypothetical protein